MKSAIALIVSLLILAAPAFAQSAAALKRELRAKEAAAKKEDSADALAVVASWASEKGLAGDAKRLFLAVLKKDPENESANIGLGNAKFEGKWLPKRKADELRSKALAAEFKAKGFVEVDDMWVDKDQVEDAKRGVFHHNGKLISKEEKQALLEGKVYHPGTGLLIDATDLPKAEAGQFPVGREGRWAGEKEANAYNSDFNHPWVVRSAYGTMLTTLPFDKHHELKAAIDTACERVGPLLGGKPPLPISRPTVLVAMTVDEYRELGNSYGDETSAASAFMMTDEARITVPFQAPVRAAICIAAQAAMAPYYVRHAAAMSYLHSKCIAAGAEVPLWFLHGVGSLAGFFDNDHVGAHFCRTMVVVKGGVKNLRGFFNSFAINGDMEQNDITYNWTVAGLMLHFAMNGGNKETTDAMVAVTKAFETESGIEKAIADLQKVLIAAEPKIAEHMQKLMDNNR